MWALVYRLFVLSLMGSSVLSQLSTTMQQLQRQNSTTIDPQTTSSPSTVPVVTSPTSSRTTTVQSQLTLTCTDEYRNMSGHTLCMTDNEGLGKHGVSSDDKLMITQYHNKLRASVQPPASDLLKLRWDERLAAVAEKWAKQCTVAHDKERSILDLDLSIGQSTAAGYETWQQVMQLWYDEIKVYRYGIDLDSFLGINGYNKIAHFTQIVQNGTYLIGCGYAEGNNTQNTENIRYYVCDYAAGQTKADLVYPYTLGASCSGCPNSCVNGLCDCDGLICDNNGELDPTTCTCKCTKLYKGRTCEITDCPLEDYSICGRSLYVTSSCDKYVNLHELCPYMCGICPDKSDGRRSVRRDKRRDLPKHANWLALEGSGRRDDRERRRAEGENELILKI